MNKIFIYILLISCLIHQTVSAQYNLTLTIQYPAPSYLSDWNNSMAGIMTVIHNTPIASPVSVKFRTQVSYSNGGIIATSNDATAQIYSIRAGANTFTLDKVLQLENLQFTDGVIANSLQTTGKLPEGSYQLCLELIGSQRNEVLTKSPVCRPFTQVTYQLPYLLAPNDKTWLDASIAQSVITFRWTPLVPQLKERVVYLLQVFEVLDGQKPVQALRSNQPILNAEVRNTTQYVWRPQLSLKDTTGHVFIWTVQTLDYKGIPISSADDNNQGRSEPKVFGVCDKLNNKIRISDEAWEKGRQF